MKNQTKRTLKNYTSKACQKKKIIVNLKLTFIFYFYFFRDQFTARYQFVQDACDIIIPTAGLGWIGFDEGIVGIAG
jgi:hypothetical protein